MCRANPLWGAPRIHGELLKLGIEISEATVSKYMIRRSGPPSQTWRSFLENHAKDLIALDFFTVPTATFRVLFELIILSHDRRQILHFNVTAHRTAKWTARQLLEASGTDEMPGYLVRDRDSIYGKHFTARPLLFRSPRFRRHANPPGKTLTRNASLARSAENALTILSFSENAT
jgi:hypothetical protein